MTASTRPFPTLLVGSLACGRGLMDTTSPALFALIAWLAGGEVFTHQMRLVYDEAALAAQAALGGCWRPIDDANADDWKAFAAELVTAFGETLDVAPAAKPFHRMDAVIADAVEQVGGDPSRVMVVRP